MVGFWTVHVNPCRVLKRIAQVHGLAAEQVAHAVTLMRMGLESLVVQHTHLLDVLSIVIAYVEECRPLGLAELERVIQELSSAAKQ